MKTNLAIAGQFPGQASESVPRAVGGRHTYLNHYRGEAPPQFKGSRSKHRLVLMRIGSAAFVRGEQVDFIEEGDGLLLPAGSSGIKFFGCPLRGLETEIFEFDQRTLAPRFRDSPAWERLAYEFNGSSIVPASGPLHFAGMAKAICDLDRHIPAGRRFHVVFGELFSQYRLGLDAFLRSAFYLARWRLFINVEKFVTQADGVAKLAAEYPGGEKQLRKDCRLYAGVTPETIIAKRRCQLATAWLRCGHSIDEVGKALGFSSNWEFQSFYSGRMRKSCSAVQKMPPLTSLGPDELDEVMRPWWWSGEGPSRVDLPKGIDSLGMSELERDREAQRRSEEVAAKDEDGEKVELMPDPYAMYDIISHRKNVPADPAVRRQRAVEALAAKRAEEAEYLEAKRAKVAAEILESAADFIAMKTTIAAVLVPIFDDPQIIEAKAA